LVRSWQRAFCSLKAEYSTAEHAIFCCKPILLLEIPISSGWKRTVEIGIDCLIGKAGIETEPASQPEIFILF
jgi:hypothetical protein